MFSQQLIGISTAGVGTAILAPAHRVQFDVGVMLRLASETDFLCLTHAHPDHIGAIINWLAIRQMRAGTRPPPTILLSEAANRVLEPMLQVLPIMFTNPPPYSLIICEPGDVVQISRNIVIQVLWADHVVPCQGYLLCERRSYLNPALEGLSSNEIAAIARLRDPNRPVNLTRLIGLCGYSGDTTHRWFELNRELLTTIDMRETEMAIECSYVAETHRESAALYGHMHSSEFISGVRSFSFTPVPVHFSLRTTQEERDAVVEASEGVHLAPANYVTDFPL